MAFVLNDNGWSPSGLPWAEVTPRSGESRSTGSMSYAGGNQQLYSIYVYWSDIMQWVADLLGSNIYNPSTGNLDRQLPMIHPVWDWLRCSRVAGMKGYVPESKAVHPATFSDIVSTQWEFGILDLVFEQPKFRMLTDDRTDAIYGLPAMPWNGAARAEYERFLEGYSVPRTEFV